MFGMFRKGIRKLDFSDFKQTQPWSFKIAVKMCNHTRNLTPEFIANTFYCLGAMEGLKSGVSNPAEGELFLKQMEMWIKGECNGEGQEEHRDDYKSSW